MDLMVVLPLFLCLGRVLDGSTNVDQRSRGAREGWPHVRPKRETKSVKGSFHVSPEHVYLQTNQNHSIPCLSWAGEELLFTFWNKGDLELARSVPAGVGEDYRLNDRYGISDDHALVVRNVQKDDQGVYICKVVFKTGHQKANSITVTVLDTLFPATNGDLVANASLFLERGQRHELLCPILAMETAAGSYTIYWSEDIGDSKFTRIIGARYSDGETKVMDNYNGDYDVKEGDLVAKSFNKLSTRLWCHLFREGPSWMSSGYIKVTGKVTSEERCPSISQCESCEGCAVKVEDKHLRLNCSVENIYPELDELSWSVAECDTPVSISTESYIMYNKTTETFIQKEELRINLTTDASINCTLQCVASGLPIANPTITASVFVTGGLVPSETTDVYSLAIIIPVVVVVIIVIMVLVLVRWIPILRKHRCVICQEQGRPVDGDAETNVEENPICETAVHEENVPLIVQNPPANASTQIDLPPDYTEVSVRNEAGPSSTNELRFLDVRGEHNHYTVHYLIHMGGKYARRLGNAKAPRKRGDTTKPAHLQRRDRKDHVPQEVELDKVESGQVRAADVPLPDFKWEDEEPQTPSEWQGRRRQNSLDNTSTRDELSINKTIVEGETDKDESHGSSGEDLAVVPKPTPPCQRRALESAAGHPQHSLENSHADPSLHQSPSVIENPTLSKVEEMEIEPKDDINDDVKKKNQKSDHMEVAGHQRPNEVPELELQKEDDYITKTDDEQDTSISHLATQQPLVPANNLKKEAEETERVSSAADEEECKPLLLDVGIDEISPSQYISDEQVDDTDQSEELLQQATPGDFISNEEGTIPEEVSSTVQTTSELTDTCTGCTISVKTPDILHGNESEQDVRSNSTTSSVARADADANMSFTSTPPSGPPYQGTETPISTFQSRTIDLSDRVTPDESHGSSGKDLAVVPKPTPPCQRRSLDSAARLPQPSPENSHADPSLHQSPSAIENYLRSDDEEIESDPQNDIHSEASEPELLKEDDFNSKVDNEPGTCVSHSETQQLLEPANNLKKEAEETERVSSAADEEESKSLLLEVGTGEILPSQDISDEQVNDTDQSEEPLLQANPISTVQSPKIDQFDPFTPDESHGSSGEDLALVPKPTPPCQRRSLDSAAGHPQHSLEISHADPSLHQSPSAIENPTLSNVEEMEIDLKDDITDDVKNENQKSDHMEVAGHQSPNDRSEQCEQDMEADMDADEVGSKSTDASAEVAMDTSDEDARPLLKEKETGIRESQRMKELKAANPLKKENILKNREAHLSKPPSSVHS